MVTVALRRKISDRLAGEVALLLYRRPLPLKTGVPIISFTFDDFPRSALLAGGRILNRFDVRSTYYVSLGLMGEEGAPGQMFVQGDLEAVVAEGHELGCHTFEHCHSLNTKPAAFERSIIRNQLALCEMLPGVSFRTFAYPKSGPRLGTKRRAGKYFQCCRGGGKFQTYNAGTADLNCLSCFFLEQSRDNPDAVKETIDENCRRRGWLIFATHDICNCPSPYGCTPEFFEEIVRYAVNSGARILPVAQACGELMKDAECCVTAVPPTATHPLCTRGERFALTGFR